MSRLSKKPVVIPDGVVVQITNNTIHAKCKQVENSVQIHDTVECKQEENTLMFSPLSENDVAMAGTMRSLTQNLLIGVSQGFEKKLELLGVGYRVQAKGKTLALQLGFSHPVNYLIPEGIKIETPSQTEIVVKGSDKQRVGQAAAEIRAFRPPEPYKGKGVRYADEHVLRKEGRKSSG